MNAVGFRQECRTSAGILDMSLLRNLFSIISPLSFTYEKKLNLGVKGEGAEVGEEVAGGAVEVAPAHVRRYPHLILHVEDKKKNLCNQSILLRWRPHMYAAIFTSSCRLKKKIKKTLQSINSVEMAPSHVRRHPHLVLQVEQKIFAINQCC